MTSQFLITTAITETWNLKGSVLFAGDWCYKKNEITGSEWENYSTVPRRWADFSVLEKDYKYLYRETDFIKKNRLPKIWNSDFTNIWNCFITSSVVVERKLFQN